MLRLFAGMLLALTCAFASADERGTADEAVAMVNKAIAAIKANGREAVIAEVNAFNPKYKDRDLYVTIMDLNGMELAHGSNKKMQGISLLDFKDQDGKPYIRTRIELAKSKGKGWQDYTFVNPVSKALEPKSMYFVLHEGLIVACGIYKAK